MSARCAATAQQGERRWTNVAERTPCLWSRCSPFASVLLSALARLQVQRRIEKCKRILLYQRARTVAGRRSTAACDRARRGTASTQVAVRTSVHKD